MLQGLTYGLKYKARALESQKGHSESSRFLVATCSLVEPNQLHLIELNEEDEELVCVNVYPHSTAVEAIAASPSDASIVLTAHTNVKGSHVDSSLTLWKLAGDEMNSVLESLREIPSAATSLLWEETAPDLLFAATDLELAGWDVEAESPKPKFSFSLGEDTATVAVGGLSMNPHFSSVVALCVGDTIVAFDLRDAQKSDRKAIWKIPNADADRIRDIDFNPNRPYYLCGGGDEGIVKFWDYRKPTEGPVASLSPGHSHWISTVQFNPHHDSLVLSSGTDCCVNLYSARSVSSAPVVTSSTVTTAGVSEQSAVDYLITSYDRYSQSVYRTCWSASDAWVYAHLCYDGKVVVSTVPEAEKMKILTA